MLIVTIYIKTTWGLLNVLIKKGGGGELYGFKDKKNSRGDIINHQYFGIYWNNTKHLHTNIVIVLWNSSMLHTWYCILVKYEGDISIKI